MPVCVKNLALQACQAALDYDKEVRACANDPEKMSSHCTSQGKSLDDLYMTWISLALMAITIAKEEEK